MVYKLASGVIADRIKPSLNQVILKCQTGFIKGRQISDSTRLVYDLLHATETFKGVTNNQRMSSGRSYFSLPVPNWCRNTITFDQIEPPDCWPEDTESFISSITPPGYKFTHVPRNVKKGGGVGFFIKEDLSFERVSKNSYQAFESISIQISTEGAKDVIFHVVYRPPNLSKSQFLDEFGMFLEGAALLSQ